MSILWILQLLGSAHCLTQLAARSPLDLPKRRAFASLLYGSWSPGVVDLLVMFSSLRQQLSTDVDLLVIIPEGDAALSSQPLLERHGLSVVQVPAIRWPKSMEESKKVPRHLSMVFSKLAVFNLTRYEQVVLLDSDMLFLKVRPEDVFSECAAELCAAEDLSPFGFASEYGSPDQWADMNTGLVVIRPSSARFNQLLDQLHEETHAYQTGDQGFLNFHIHQPSENWSFQFLRSFWNSCSHSDEPEPLTAVIHWCGPKKPHKSKIVAELDPQSYPPAYFPGLASFYIHSHTALALWDGALHKAVPCTQLAEADCSTSCTWCGHYCSDQAIACSSELFRCTDEPEPNC